MNILIDTDAIKTQALPFSVCQLLFSSSCSSLCILKMAAAASGIISVCSKQEEEVKRCGIRQIMFFRRLMQKKKKKKKKRPPEKLFRKLPLHHFGQGNWVRWHPAVMRELWKWAQCDPNRNGGEGRNDVRMPPQGHHHGKSPFFQNKKKNTGYCNEAKLQWDKLKKKQNSVLGNRWTTENYLWSNSLFHSVCQPIHFMNQSPLPGLYNHMDFS